jgi:hypothetical protein
LAHPSSELVLRTFTKITAASWPRTEETPIEEQIADIVGEPEVDCAVDAVGFEASAQPGEEASAVVLN